MPDDVGYVSLLSYWGNPAENTINKEKHRIVELEKTQN